MGAGDNRSRQEMRCRCARPKGLGEGSSGGNRSGVEDTCSPVPKTCPRVEGLSLYRRSNGCEHRLFKPSLHALSQRSRKGPPSQGGAPWSQATPRFAGSLRIERRADDAVRTAWEVVCGAITDNKSPRFPGIFFLQEPSDGLEPSTPSLPWRFRAAGEGLRNSACCGVFPATTSFVGQTHPSLEEP
jgi:hypothetical protein